MTRSVEVSGVPEFPDYPCVCFGPGSECACIRSERALRTIAYLPAQAQPMTAEQRDWCKSEIAAIEGYTERDAEGTDEQVARTTLNAWLDYCRDKGML